MKALFLSLAAGAGLAAPADAAPAARSPMVFAHPVADDVLTRMFVWWNAAFRQPVGFTRDSFAQYFTKDAVMRINGKDSAKGLDDLASHFRMIQKRASAVEIKLPFLESFSSPDGSKIFTYHLIDSVDNGKEEHDMVMGYATLRGGKIAQINFVSISGVPGPFLK